MSLATPPPTPFRSGQQILLGDKVVVKGERLGTIKYIGKLDFDLYDQIYIGVNLDMPGKFLMYDTDLFDRLFLSV